MQQLVYSIVSIQWTTSSRYLTGQQGELGLQSTQSILSIVGRSKYTAWTIPLLDKLSNLGYLSLAQLERAS